MTHNKIPVKRLPLRLVPDPRRTITRFFWPAEDKARRIINRVLSLDSNRVSELVNEVLEQFRAGNPGLEEILLNNYDRAIRQSGVSYNSNFEIRLLTGAYFSMEYAFESAALFNPSMVPAIHQPFLSEGRLRFLMSLRAVGEGHISSITFRRGVVDLQGEVELKPTTLEVHRLKRKPNRTYQKPEFIDKLQDIGAMDELATSLIKDLPDSFSMFQLRHKIEYARSMMELTSANERTLELMQWIASSEYEIERQATDSVEDIVLFPLSETESQGMEDMRIVQFHDDDDSVRYYGTYTAYNGTSILPQILEVIPNRNAKVHTLHGKFARNKGMALFPQRLDGEFAAIGRIDGENMFLLKSDDIDFWDNAVEIVQPKYDWEFVQIGNCGSPLLTDAGWLVLTHGVGAMRKYSIGAMLLDKDDPSKIIGQLERPLLAPNEEERTGYVPNVVYSCGAMIHGDNLIVPYGISDAATGFAVVVLDDLLAELA
ncbi:MAG: glycoside hydrolase family 130 protein [Planctomycetota bacterium]|jgi:predicted GH43/DUF377 family glycosyl hydrolase